MDEGDVVHETTGYNPMGNSWTNMEVVKCPGLGLVTRNTESPDVRA
jgi:hypothetical protein